MDKKKFLFVSWTGLIGDSAWQVVKEGHEVKYYVDDKDERSVTDGFVQKVDDWKKEIDWADVIIFDDVLGLGEEAEKLRKQGKAVIGGTAYTDRLEDDRTFGQEELKKAGVSITSHMGFTTFDEAIEYVKQNPGRYVIKFSGKAQNDKQRLFVGEEERGVDVINVLQDYKRVWAEKDVELQLQKKIQGVEVAVGAFFNGREFIEPINVNFEHKRLFPGNIGPQTGEMGTLMFWSQPNKLFHMTLKKMETKLAEEGYIGYIDINCIVNGNGVYPLEFTARFGYPTIFIQQEGMNEPFAEFLYKLAHGEKFSLKTKSGFQVGVRIAVPPYPFDDEKTFNNYSKDSVIIFKEGYNREGVHIEDVRLLNDEWLVAGSAGVVLVVCGCGPTMKQAQQQAYNRITNIMIPNMYYRKDIGDRWFEDSDKLHSWGYLHEI